MATETNLTVFEEATLRAGDVVAFQGEFTPSYSLGIYKPGDVVTWEETAYLNRIPSIIQPDIAPTDWIPLKKTVIVGTGSRQVTLDWDYATNYRTNGIADTAGLPPELTIEAPSLDPNGNQVYLLTLVANVSNLTFRGIGGGGSGGNSGPNGSNSSDANGGTGGLGGAGGSGNSYPVLSPPIKEFPWYPPLNQGSQLVGTTYSLTIGKGGNNGSGGTTSVASFPSMTVLMQAIGGNAGANGGPGNNGSLGFGGNGGAGGVGGSGGVGGGGGFGGPAGSAVGLDGFVGGTGGAGGAGGQGIGGAGGTGIAGGFPSGVNGGAGGLGGAGGGVTTAGTTPNTSTKVANCGNGGFGGDSSSPNVFATGGSFPLYTSLGITNLGDPTTWPGKGGDSSASGSLPGLPGRIIIEYTFS